MQILVFVQGFSTKVATAKTLIFSDLHSRIRILYESAYAGNHCIFSVVHSSHSRTRILYKKCSCRACLRLLELIPTANVDSRTRILYKSIHAGYHDMFAVLKFFHARAPGGPGAGSGIRSLLSGAPGPDPHNFLQFSY